MENNIKGSRDRARERPGFRKLVYFDGASNPLNGTWQWKYGGMVVLYSPQGRKFLASPGEVLYGSCCSHSDNDDHEPVTPANIKEWIGHHGMDAPEKKCRKKPKQSIRLLSGRLIEIVRTPVSESREKVTYSILSPTGEVMSSGVIGGGLSGRADVEGFIRNIGTEIEKADVDAIVESIMGSIENDQEEVV